MDKSTDASASSLDTLDGDNGIEEVPEVPVVKKKDGTVDNRKLVYEDIWDDAPSPWQRTVPNPELPTTPQLGEEFTPWAAPQNAASEKPQEFTEEEITRRAQERKKQLQGEAVNKGMERFMDQRAKDLADEEEQCMKEIVGDDGFKPSWYSRQQEKVMATVRKLNAFEKPDSYDSFEPTVKPKETTPGSAQASEESKEKTESAKKQHVFAPPPRGKVASTPAPQNELDEMD